MTDNNKQNSIAEEEKRIQENVSKLRNRIAVFSGKGGVGKTTVSVNLAYALQVEGYSTGLLDADITGPNIAKMLGVNDYMEIKDSKMIPFEKYGAKMVSVASLIEPGQAIIWRGPIRSKLINQFLADVVWGELDYLIADLPPGTGDEILTISMHMKPQVAIIVTTPQEVSVMDAARAITMAKKLEIPFIGVVENMSGFICPHCNSVLNIFGEGGGKKLAEEYNVPFLGAIPVDIHARVLGDRGKPIILDRPDCEVSNSFKSIAGLIQDFFNNYTVSKKEDLCQD